MHFETETDLPCAETASNKSLVQQEKDKSKLSLGSRSKCSSIESQSLEQQSNNELKVDDNMALTGRCNRKVSSEQK